MGRCVSKGFPGLLALPCLELFPYSCVYEIVQVRR